MKLEPIARLARAGNRIVSFCAMVLILAMMFYGGFSLYDDWKMTHGAFESELMKFAPSEENAYSLAQLMELNPDVRGWLKIDDTHISYPVMQGENDMEYVNHDPLGNFALSGSIFLSCVNDPAFQDAYSLLYGHHIENGAMFGDVTKFLDETYYEKHRTGSLVDLNGQNRMIEIFCVLRTDAGDQVVYDPQSWKENTDGLLAYLKQNALHYREGIVSAGDCIIGLSTCYDAQTNGRVLVFGRLLPAEGEDGQ